jgi:hypothetical protein
MDENEFMFGDRSNRVRSKKFLTKRNLLISCFLIVGLLCFVDYYRIYYQVALAEAKILNDQLITKIQEYSVALYFSRDVSSIDHESNIQERRSNGIFQSEMEKIRVTTASVPPVPKNPLHHQSIIRGFYTNVFKTQRVHLDTAADHAAALGLDTELYTFLEGELQNYLAKLLKEMEQHLIEEAKEKAPVVIEAVAKEADQGLANLLRWQFTPNQTEKCPEVKDVGEATKQ